MFREERKVMIEELICDRKLKPMRFRELAGFLQIPKEERSELSEILDALIREGKVAQDSEGRYVNDASIHVKGQFFGTKNGYGFVRPEGAGSDEDIFIPADYVKDAMHGDTVTVSVTRQAYQANGKQNRAEGVIEKVLERANEEIVGIFQRSKNFGFVRPDNQKLDFDVYIAKEHTKGAVSGQKVVCKLRHYGTAAKNPEGMITEILGHINDPGVDVVSVVRAYGLPTEFPPEVYAEVEQIPDFVSEEETEGRLDLRDVQMVTIDGEDAKDLDDAISVEKHGDSFTLGVHIADVSHYVKENSEIDKEAINRGTSVYLADRVIPMLPHALSNGICSLNAGEDRLALSCIMEINAKGQVTSHKIAETVVRIDRRMSYSKVKAIIEDHDPEACEAYADFVPMFETMAELSARIRERREERGSIDFDFPECKIIVGEDGKTKDIVPYDRNTATRLIEDFMLAANETIAEEFYWAEMPFVYRNHETPDPEKMMKLNIFINNFGYHIHSNGDTVHPMEIQKLLYKVTDTPEESLISRLTLRSMKQAKYSPDCKGHFGLAAKYYCHFTSPIRRYPDLQIHRIIKEYLHGMSEKRIQHYESILDERATQSSVCERRADEAEREVEKRKKAEYMSHHLGEVYDGVISGVASWGFYVELQNTVEGNVRAADLKGDFYRYDESQARLVGERTGCVYALGQRIRVQLAAVDPLISSIDFVPYMK